MWHYRGGRVGVKLKMNESIRHGSFYPTFTVFIVLGHSDSLVFCLWPIYRSLEGCDSLTLLIASFSFLRLASDS
jgi:hypothetical protein